MKRILIAALSAGAIVLLAACSSSSSKNDGTPGAKQQNAADVSFAQMMIPHHSQAVEMADKEIADGQNAQLKALARTIKGAQGPEIEQMKGFLAAWGVDAAGAQGHESMAGMPGMMSAADMAAFRQAAGSKLDRLFATMMIAHHRGAVQMANTELASGMSPQAKALARSIVAGQTAEIARLTALLAVLPA